MSSDFRRVDTILMDVGNYISQHDQGYSPMFLQSYIRVFGKCYEQKSLIITTNMDFSHWKDFLFDEKLTIGILDRIIHYYNFVILTETVGKKRELL